MSLKNVLFKVKEYQTLGLFATLGVLTLLAVLLFKVVLFAPVSNDSVRIPAHEAALNMPLPSLAPEKK